MKQNSIQFYINTRLDSTELLEVFSKLLDAQVESLEYPNAKAFFFLMETFYDDGFPTGVNLSWQPGADEISQQLKEFDYLRVATELARHYDTLVATDLPEDDPDSSNPYYWCVAAADGLLSKIVQFTSDSDEVEGLILDMSSKKSLNEVPKR